MADQGRLIDAAMRLRASSPGEWDEFTRAMREFAAASTAEMIKADAQNLQRVQGRAQMANEISSLLHQAPTLAEGVRDKRVREQLRAGRNPGF